MKKLVLFAAVVLSMSVMSCGKGEKAEATVDSDSLAAAEQVLPADTAAAADTVAADTAAVKA